MNQAPKKGRRPRPQRDVDAEWIQSRIGELHRTQRELAAMLGGVSPAVVSRILNNNRQVSLDEFAALCEFLDVPPEALLPKLGYDIRTARRRVAIVGAVTDDARITHVTPEAGRLVDIPQIGARDLRALVIRAKSGRLQAWDGALVLYEETARGALPAYDRLAVVEVLGEVVPVLGVLRRGSKAKTMTLARFATGDETEVSEVINAHPVHQLVME